MSEILIKYAPAFLVWLILVIFSVYIINTTPFVTETLDYVSISTEGLLALLAATGLLFIVELKQYKQIYQPLYFGLSLLALSMTTDALDEFVEMPAIYTTLFEGIFQIIGFFLLLTGLYFWSRYYENLNKKYKDLATIDFLTGIANRRHFIFTLENEIKRSERYENHLSLMLFDIDTFKKINDEYGHDIGDNVLIELSRYVLSQIRKVDLFARYGGEEFVILLPNTDREEARGLAEKIREGLSEIKISKVGSITISIGVSQFIKGEDYNTLLRRADEALYKAKAEGRNTVIVK